MATLKNMIPHSANGPWDKSLNFTFPTKHVIPESLKFSHWLSEILLYCIYFFLWTLFSRNHFWTCHLFILWSNISSLMWSKTKFSLPKTTNRWPGPVRSAGRVWRKTPGNNLSNKTGSFDVAAKHVTEKYWKRFHLPCHNHGSVEKI